MCFFFLNEEYNGISTIYEKVCFFIFWKKKSVFTDHCELFKTKAAYDQLVSQINERVEETSIRTKNLQIF